MPTPKKLHLAALRRQRELLALVPVWTENLITAISPDDDDMDDDALLGFIAGWSFQAGAQLMLEVGPVQDNDLVMRVYERLLREAKKDWEEHVDWRHAMEASIPQQRPA